MVRQSKINKRKKVRGKLSEVRRSEKGEKCRRQRFEREEEVKKK